MKNFRPWIWIFTLLFSIDHIYALFLLIIVDDTVVDHTFQFIGRENILYLHAVQFKVLKPQGLGLELNFITNSFFVFPQNDDWRFDSTVDFDLAEIRDFDKLIPN